jgi:predicted transposase/invertase (TIGR01784 family)
MALSKFLDPKNDYAFKQIFGTEKNKDILVFFLNDILGYEGKNKVTEVDFLKTHQDPQIAAYRQSIIDVMVTSQDGTKFVVEMQLTRHAGFEKRAQYYAAKAYSQQILEEDENHKKMAVYAKLKGVIFIAIANFILFPDKQEWSSTHHMLDIETYENDLKDFQFVFVELPKFKKNLGELKNIREKWAFFFKHAEECPLSDITRLIDNTPQMQRAFEAIDQASWSEEELNTYEQREKTILDNAVIEEQKIADAEKKGKEEGREEEKIEMVIKMLAKNKPIDEIIEFTGLSIEEILKLKNKL